MSFSKREKEGYLDDIDFEKFIERREVREFIGKNYDHYREIWLKDYRKKRRVRKMLVGFHWNALGVLCWPAWFAYRKMYTLLAIMTALMAAFSFAQVY